MSEITDKLRADAAWAGARTATTVRQIGRDCAEAADYIDRLEARVAVLEGALKPFAELAAAMSDNPKPDDWIAWGYNSADILYGDFRAARRALTPVAETPNQEPAP